MKMRFFFSPKIGVKNSKFNSSWTEVIKLQVYRVLILLKKEKLISICSILDRLDL